MKILSTRAVVPALGVAIASAAGLGVISTPSAWLAFATAATSALILTYLWKRPAQSMSESIQQTLR